MNKRRKCSTARTGFGLLVLVGGSIGVGKGTSCHAGWGVGAQTGPCNSCILTAIMHGVAGDDHR